MLIYRILPVVLPVVLLLSIGPSEDSLALTEMKLNTWADSPLSKPDGTGFGDRIMKEAFLRKRIAVKIRQLPVERSILNANQGRSDGEFVRIAGISRIYKNLIQVPESIISFEFVVFTRKAAFQPDHWDTLVPYHVAIVIGWKILEENIVGAKSRTDVRNKEILFNLLDQDRCDVVVYSKLLGIETIRTLNIKHARILEPPLATMPMFLYLHKKHAELVPLITEALRELKADGTFSVIEAQTLSTYRVLEPNGGNMYIRHNPSMDP